jgi:hypothetical protein
VVATGIEIREVRSEPARVEVPEAKPAASAPSFRLRPQMPKLPSAALFPLKTAAAQAEAGARKDPLARPEAPADGGRGDCDGAGGAVPDKPGDAAPSAEPEAPDVAARSTEPGRPFLHPPLPPQERFQEWGRLRAPVRELERPPSLFERVTASFGRQRQERPGGPEPALAGADAAGPHLAASEEDPSYDIPAFLRR